MTVSFALVTASGLPGAGTAFVLDKFPLSIASLVASKTVTIPWLTWYHHDLS